MCKIALDLFGSRLLVAANSLRKRVLNQREVSPETHTDFDENAIEDDEEPLEEAQRWYPPAEEPAPSCIVFELLCGPLELRVEFLDSGLIANDIVGIGQFGIEWRLCRYASVGLI